MRLSKEERQQNKGGKSPQQYVPKEKRNVIGSVLSEKRNRDMTCPLTLYQP